MTAASAPANAVTLVTQTRILPGKDAEFAAWQQGISDAVATFPGFIDHSVIEPAPPTQLDWVIIQRFTSVEAARNWLQSDERRQRLAQIEPILVGEDDIHIFATGQTGPPSQSVAAVVSTKVPPGKEENFRSWQRRIAAAESAFPGFQGSKLEPPVPGVQEDWVNVVRFDSDEHLQAWLSSPERKKLLDEATDLSPDWHMRTVRGGFDGWFTFGEKPAPGSPPIWKQNMVVLLVLYPVVFLWGQWFGTPLLADNGVPFWLTLFIGNIVSVSLTGYFLIAWASRSLKWWMVPRAGAPAWTNAAGTAVVLAIYGVSLAIFSLF